MSLPRSYRLASLALLTGLLVMAGLTFRHYGIAWDEPLRFSYGRYLLAGYSGLPAEPEDKKAVESTNLYLYGGAFDLPAALVVRWSDGLLAVGEVERWHLVNALAGILGIVGCWATARLLAGERAAFWAALFLAATPAYYGQMFINPKDIPFAAGTIWALYALLRTVRTLPRIGWGNLALFGVLAGWTMGVRIGGIFLLGYLLAALALNNWLSRPGKNIPPPGAKAAPIGPGRTWRGLLGRVLLPFLATSALAFAVMLAFWPWAAESPLRHPVQALLAVGRFDWQQTVLYRGAFIPAGQLPASYIFRYFALTLPEFLLVLLLAGVGIGIFALLRRKSRGGQPAATLIGIGVLLLAIATPVLVALLARSVLYDGVRHLLFILPPLACLAGLAFDTLLAWLGQIHRGYALAAGLVVSAGILFTVVQAARLHPYEYIYYNRLAGGLESAYRDYESEYWGAAFSEAARWLVQSLQEAGGLSGDRYRVYLACGNDFSASYYFPQGLKITHDREAADFYLGGIRWFCQDELPGETLYTVSRLGVPLAVVKEP